MSEEPATDEDGSGGPPGASTGVASAPAPRAALGVVSDSTAAGWERAAGAVAGFQELTPGLWLLAVLFFGVGDVVTTAATGLGPAVVEGNPAVAAVLAGDGLAGFVLVKVAVLLGAAVLWHFLEEPHDVAVPLALAVVGVGLTTYNAFVVAAVVGA